MKVAVSICFLCFALLLLAVPGNAQYQLGRSVIGNGGAPAAGDDHMLNGTAGQAFIGLTGGDEYLHSIGFWIGTPQGTGVDEDSAVPAVFALGQNHPNPFNPLTTIRYAVPRSSRVLLRLYDVRGRELATLVDAEHETGTFDLDFNASALPSGVYFYRMEAGAFSETKKLVLLK